MKSLIDLFTNTEPGPGYATDAVLALLGHSILLGFILVITTFLVSRYLGTGMMKGKPSTDPKQLLLSAANQLFLCVGLTGTMLLVNENLVRAFAIIAALTLIRFRVRLDAGGIGASLLFSILVGMACGLNELAIAWSVTGVYVLLMLLMLALFSIFGALKFTKD